MSQIKLNQTSLNDFNVISNLLSSKTPFTFVRFSDGEMEVIRNEEFFIGDGKINWRKGSYNFDYPDFDKKEFLPSRDFNLRNDLLTAAMYKSGNFIKGIPARHNSAISDRDFMIAFNGGNLENLTFSDLFLNQNFLKFRREIIPSFFHFESVFYFGNFRAKPENFRSSWVLVPVQDNFFQDYDSVVDKAISALMNVPRNSLILSSASSLSNIVGHKLNSMREDLTFVDIGTSLHDLVGLNSFIREYQIVLLPNNPKNMYRKIRLRLQKNNKLKW
jgi:hypothetical protein